MCEDASGPGAGAISFVVSFVENSPHEVEVRDHAVSLHSGRRRGSGISMRARGASNLGVLGLSVVPETYARRSQSVGEVFWFEARRRQVRSPPLGPGVRTVRGWCAKVTALWLSASLFVSLVAADETCPYTSSQTRRHHSPLLDRILARSLGSSWQLAWFRPEAPSKPSRVGSCAV